MAFSGTGKKEDMSMRLRAQNIKNAREQTQKLETESRKMEERLKELKMAMTREKAEREQKGGGFWRSGKSGSLGNDYTKDILNKPLKSAEKKKAKVKVLKDEPIVTPERSKGPGTIGYIAQRDISNKENKIKGPKCGQCEQKGAQVTCLECGEDYCAGCFASFHIKGALKKHRSVPVRAGDARIFSPRPPLSVSSKSDTSVNGHYSSASISSEENPMKLTLTEIDFTLSPQMIQGNGYGHEHDTRRTPVGASHTFEGPSLLDGQYNEADSAAAFQLALQAWRKPEGQKSPRKHDKVASVEHGTSTSDTPQEAREIKIEFKSGGGLTYAEKLLLKKHRRSELDPMETPRLQSERGDSLTPTSSVRSRLEAQSVSQNGLPFEEDGPYSRPESEISIIEMTDDKKLPLRGIDQSKTYYVREDPNEKEVLETAREEKAQSALSAKKARRQANVTPPPARSAKNRSARHRKVKSPMSQEEIIRDGSELGRPDLSKPMTARMIEVLPKNEEAHYDDTQNYSTSRPKSRSQRPSSGRPASRAASRPVSRAASRLAIFGEGHLTKAPSSALQAVAHMQVELPVGDLSGGTALTDFFTGGSQLVQADRVLTPRVKSARPKEDKWKISNKLYQMGPRAWRPDSSLGDVVPVDQIVIEPVTLPEETLQMDAMDAYEIKLLTPAVNTQTTHLMGPERSWQPEQSVFTPRHSRPSHLMSGRLSQAGRESRSGRLSQAIVIEGDDMSRFDDAPNTQQVRDEDEETLNQLDWELASEAGMVTDDGKISRLSMIDLGEHEAEQEDMDLNTLRELMTPRDKGIDIRHHLRESELMEDFEEMEAQIMEDEVKALR